MKKLFIALMAVCVMVSCGGDKKNGGNNASDNTGNNTEQNDTQQGSSTLKTPGQVIDKMISSTETLLNKAEQAVREDNPEIIVSAFEKYADQMAEIYNKYGNMMSNMSREEQEKYRDKAIELASLMEKIQYLEDDLNRLKPTPSQEKRMEEALKKLGML